MFLALIYQPYPARRSFVLGILAPLNNSARLVSSNITIYFTESTFLISSVKTPPTGNSNFALEKISHKYLAIVVFPELGYPCKRIDFNLDSGLSCKKNIKAN